MLTDILDGLFHIAKADDQLHPNEERFLAGVAKRFGLTETEFSLRQGAPHRRRQAQSL